MKMKHQEFNVHKNFHLNDLGWGEAQIENIISLLDNVVAEFYKNLDMGLVKEKPVYILNSTLKNPPTEYPEIITSDKFNLMFLSAKHRFWCQYSYQFAHELCHFVIDSNFHASNDKFGWFEEVICELASIYCLDKMSETWKTNPPYENWRTYSTSLKEYVSNIKNNPDVLIDKPFKLWLQENFLALSENRYKRVENRIVALELLPLFEHTSDFWLTIQYLKFVKVTESMGLDHFLSTWKKEVPENLKGLIDEIYAKLI